MLIGPQVVALAGMSDNDRHTLVYKFYLLELRRPESHVDQNVKSKDTAEW